MYRLKTAVVVCNTFGSRYVPAILSTVLFRHMTLKKIVLAFSDIFVPNAFQAYKSVETLLQTVKPRQQVPS